MSERTLWRGQRLYALERNGLYWTGGGWGADIRLASIYPEKQAKRMARIDIGMNCELVEVMPVLLVRGDVAPPPPLANMEGGGHEAI